MSHRSRSKVTWVEVKLGSHTKAGGLSMSSCFIHISLLVGRFKILPPVLCNGWADFELDFFYHVMYFAGYTRG